MKIPFRSFTLAAAIALSGCGPEKAPEVPDEVAPEFNGGGQQANIGDPVYPGPYGVGIGSVIPNYQFQGYPRATISSDALQMVQMSDFYNPTGEAVYPEGSPYGAGTKLPRAILITRSAYWCGPCHLEARDVLPAKHAEYAPYGEFLTVLDETEVRGEKAIPLDIERWADLYSLDYPGVIDPAQRLDAIIGIGAYPGNIIVRTKDMKIIAWKVAAPDTAFWQTFKDVIDGKPVLPSDG